MNLFAKLILEWYTGISPQDLLRTPSFVLSLSLCDDESVAKATKRSGHDIIWEGGVRTVVFCSLCTTLAASEYETGLGERD